MPFSFSPQLGAQFHKCSYFLGLAAPADSGTLGTPSITRLLDWNLQIALPARTGAHCDPAVLPTLPSLAFQDADREGPPPRSHLVDAMLTLRSDSPPPSPSTTPAGRPAAVIAPNLAPASQTSASAVNRLLAARTHIVASIEHSNTDLHSLH
ncbi:hypothetical protein C8R43DRAFT_1121482 [Mycena crocata]|nr:hypothetical protein C8R43DRAFT_1121482 [Mycena crocata]